jgi:pilus assembly protein Flp/PilA
LNICAAEKCCCVFLDRSKPATGACRSPRKQVPKVELNACRATIFCNQRFTFYRYDYDGTDHAHGLRARSSRLVRNEQKAKRMKNLLKDFIADESGATAIEYGLIAAGISLAIIAVVNGLGTKLNTKFTSINNSLK